MYRSIALLTTALLNTVKRPVAVAAAVLVLLAQISGQAAPVLSSLHYSLGFLVTGGYRVASVDLHEDTNPPDSEGLSTATIAINGVPADADIVAAYLYWETIRLNDTPTQARVKFRGTEIPVGDAAAVQQSPELLANNTATCWSSGQPLLMSGYRADVLRLLPMRLDANNKPTGKRVVNAADLTNHGFAQHTVSLPTRNGNQIPESAGASLVVIYRNPSEPLRKIVLYDGIHIQESLDEETRLTLTGFYKSAATKSASLSLLIAAGQPNNNERISFEAGVSPVTTTVLSTTPNPVFGGTSSERSWQDLTYDVSNLMKPLSGTPSGVGESVTVSISHVPGSGGYDCLSPHAAVFSTSVADEDHDGLPDGLEDASSALTDADNRPLPNLSQMGASSSHKDIFVEINAMRTTGAKDHGSAAYPFNGAGTTPAVVSVGPHNHMPTPHELKLVGDAYAAHEITAHFDVGDIAAYKALLPVSHQDWDDIYDSDEADAYLISANPRGGELVDEVACAATVLTCQFPGFPGTVGWKFGLQTYRDWPVDDDGNELLTSAQIDAWLAGTGANSTTHRQRFDPNRRGLFHYALWAHYRGLPKSEFPCLQASTATPPTYTPTVTGWNPVTRTCTGTGISINPDFHIPSSSSGVADLPGGNVLLSLGRWDEYVGKPFARASTMFHELGHNLNLSHGGFAPVAGNKFLGTANFVEPNCKPNYLSSMTYAFQVFGLFMDDDSIHLDYSNTAHSNLSETPSSPGDAPLSPLPSPAYRPVWYAPYPSVLATTLGVPKATRYCSGQKFDPTLVPQPSMARVYSEFSADAINWDGGGGASAISGQDVNFDASLSATLRGYNDWSNIRLDQIEAGLKVVTLQTLSGGINNFEGGLGNFEGGIPNFEGGINNFEGGISNFESGMNNFEGGITNFESGINNFEGGINNFEGAQELDVDAAKGMGRSAPFSVNACVVGETCSVAQLPNPPNPLATLHTRVVRWQPSTFGHVSIYQVSRKRGNKSSTNPFVTPTPSADSASPASPVTVETQQLPEGYQFTYRLRAQFDDPSGNSGYSKEIDAATITAKNTPPATTADAYTTARNTQLRITTRTQGLLNNDSDVDSPPSAVFAVLVTGPLNGTLTEFNSDGTFTYRPKNGFTGTDTFTYKANNGVYTTGETTPIPMNIAADVITVTVTITVTK